MRHKLYAIVGSFVNGMFFAALYVHGKLNGIEAFLGAILVLSIIELADKE